MRYLNPAKGVLVFLLILFLPFGVNKAQEKEQESEIILPEVVVPGERREGSYIEEDALTATKTETPIQDIPQSIEVIDRELIDDQGAVQLQDTVYNVSGVVPGDSFLVPYLVRGFRAEILRDGFTFSSTIFLNVLLEELTDVERIEFLKGPGSVLYGNASAGGIINIITKKPLPYLYVSAEGMIGSFDFYRGALDLSVPLNKDNSLLFRINASYRNSDSFRDFIFSERVLVAPVLSWQINPKMNLTLEGEYLYVDQPFDEGLIAVGDEVADIPFSRNLAEPTDRTEFKNYLAKATLETRFNENVSLRNAFQYYRIDADTFDHRSLVLLEDNRTLLRFIFDSTLKDEIYTTQNELNINLKTWSVDHDILIGLEYIRENFDNPARFLPASPIYIFDPVYGIEEPFNPDDVPLIRRSGKLNDLGVYVQDQINLFDRLFVLAGLRYDYLDQSLKDNTSTPDFSFNNIKNEDNEFSPRFGIAYEPIQGVSLYANYAQSFKSLLVNSFTADGSVLDPETSTQYEGGVKFYLWDGRLSSTLALYRITKRNALTPDPVNPIFAVQVDKERSQGFEFDLTAEPVRAGVPLSHTTSFKF